MTMRTITSTVIFKKPFLIGGMDAEQPAGSYQVETDEQRIENVSFVAYRRVATLIHLHPSLDHPGIRQTLTIEPADLERALQADRQSDQADPLHDQPFEMLK